MRYIEPHAKHQTRLTMLFRILFETKDVSRVKQFAQRQFAKILAGSASLQDLTFAKEFRQEEEAAIQ